MRKLLSLMLGLAGLAVQAQDEVHPDIFKQQISRTPFIQWEWADEDSVRAYQDTIGGITKMYFKDYEDVDYTSSLVTSTMQIPSMMIKSRGN